ncbi:MAG TPA: hypothetical protein ENN08_04575 [Bacteroidales bacterium]|nr:hypothetical protein [Bacteroidales bacterium]
MTAINKNNYEIFFLDYIEGRLDAAQTLALMHFLDANPELREELEGLETVRLEPNDEIRFEAKNSLKQPHFVSTGQIDEKNYEEFFAAATENDLDIQQQADLHYFLKKNPALQKEFETFIQCRLQPDVSIIFADKASLKKAIVVPFFSRPVVYRIAIAASLALLIGLAFLFEPGVDHPVEVVQYDEAASPIPGAKEDELAMGIKIETPALESLEQPSLTIETAIPDLLHNTKEHISEKEVQHTREVFNLGYLASLSALKQLETIELKQPASDLRNYYSRYYADIVMAQNMRHADEISEEDTGGGLLAQGTAVVKEIFQPGEEDINIMPASVNLWQIADVGINGFARLTGADLEFRKNTDEQGRVLSFALESQSLLINRNLRRNK